MTNPIENIAAVCALPPAKNQGRPRAGVCSALVLVQLLAAVTLIGCESEKEPSENEGVTTEHDDDDDHGSDEKPNDDDEPSTDPDKDAGPAEPESPASGEKPAEAEKPSDDTPAQNADAGPAEPKPEAKPEPEPEVKPEPAKKPVYAYIHSIGNDSDDSSTYVTLTNAIDAKSGSAALAPAQAREFEGGIHVVSGNVLENVEGSSNITQWKVDDNLTWTKGPTVNFSQYPLPEGANLFFNFQVDDHTMYMPFDITKRIVWDPTDMKIVRTIETSKLPLQVDGLMALPAGNRTGIQYKGTIKAPFFYLDEDYLKFAEKTTLAVYDRKTHEEIGLIDLPCPGLAVATQDEEGYTYYGTWDYSPLMS